MLYGGTGAVTAASETAEKREQGPPAQFLASFVRKTGAMLAPLLAYALVVYLCHNDKLKTLIAVDYYSCNRMWPQVLEASVRYPHNNKYINHAVNRALYHTGRLGDDMFVYGQQPDALMLSTESAQPLGHWRLFDTYIDLGHMNLAESMLVLCMEEKYGEQPIFLKRLALINMVKGNNGAVRVYLGALSRTLFNADWARSYLKKIDTDPNLSTDEEVQHLRSIMPEIDRDFESLNEEIFLDLLARNRRNRMAFEYLMGFYLLTGQFDKFAGNLNRLDDFDYGRIPRVYEEAILFSNYVRKAGIELRGREISQESRERFVGFRNIYIGRYRANKMAALGELARDYGDSYLFYYLYGQSGMKK
jgi:hypothetical protein